MKTFTARKNTKLTVAVLDELPQLGYGTIRKILREKDVKVNGKRVSEDVKLSVGDEVTVYYKDSDEKRLYDVVYEDENVLIANKYPKITSDDLFFKLSADKELYYIHRLDRNTSGLIVFAKNKESEKELLNGFKNRLFDKRYIAEVYGVPEKKEATLTAYLVKDAETGRVKIYDTAVKGSVKIITEYKVIKSGGGTSLLEVKLVTGKTHQIRAHLAHIGHFVIGDGKYGVESVNKKYKKNGQRLTAYKITFSFGPTDKLYYLNGKTFEIKADYV